MSDLSDVLDQGLTLLREGRLEEARRHCEAALAATPDDGLLLNLLATVALAAGEAGEAEDTSRRALDAGAGAVAHNTLGRALLALNQPHEALQEFLRAVEQDPAFADAYNHLGETYGLLGNMSEAQRALARAIEIRPDFAEAHFNLAVAFEGQDRPDAAERSLRAALQANADFAPAHYQLGRLLHRAGHYDEALKSFGEMARLQPAEPTSWTALGMCLQTTGRHSEAVECYQRAVELNPDLADAHFNLGTLHHAMGELGAAVVSYREALRLAPEQLSAVAGLAAVLQRTGHGDEAYELLEGRIRSGEDSPELVVAFAQLQVARSEGDRAVDAIERLLAREDINAVLRRKLHFILGDMLETLDRYDDAFRNYQAGNAIGASRFRAEAQQQTAEQIRTRFSAGAMASLPRATRETDKPLIIVGMPGAGAELVQRALRGHASVWSAPLGSTLAGLLASLVRSGDGTLFPDCLPQITTERLDEAVQTYLSQPGIADDAVARVVDGSPGNFLLLGLAEMLFPGARVIHCVRDPMDTIAACYLANLPMELDFAGNLSSLSGYYREYRRMMNHWAAVSSLAITEIRYEDLVQGGATGIQQLLDDIGLSWDGPDLDTFLEPLFTSARASIGRSRHYARVLGPLRAELETRDIS
ncbi:MAG: tetratricopeptide repeat protein [Gammaproteobacteria bacterium]|nr:tetratricopeptide repeat protein [Gammaproteobacteria bacterium]